MDGREDIILRSFAVEQTLNYLRLLERELYKNTLLEKAGCKLDDLRLPYRVVPFRKPESETQALQDESPGAPDHRPDQNDRFNVPGRPWLDESMHNPSTAAARTLTQLVPPASR